MSVTKIVLTGGPCAGKSTGLAIIKDRLTNLGYDVVILSEVATDVILSGVTPMNISPYDFQKLLAYIQIDRDKRYSEALESLGEKVVVIYDRGIMDAAAYLPDGEFDKLIVDMGYRHNEILNRYDGVFHLVTAAIGAPEAYTKANNAARMETLEEAIDADARTLKAWIGHPHLRVINNEGVNFEQKMTKLLSEIMSLLGEPTPLEIERKFLIKKPDINILMEKYNATASDIVQTYLTSEPGVERRVRQRGTYGDYTFYYTEKREVETGVREERERIIDIKEYADLLIEADHTKKPIKKRRYCFVYEDRYFELDIYPHWNTEAILEIEVSSIKDKFSIPEDIEVIKEVTDDRSYSNYELASK